MFRRADRWLGSSSHAGVISAAVVLIAVIGVADLLTGFDISVGLFYLLPVFIAAWYGGRMAGLAVAGLSSVAWLLANLFTARGAELPSLVMVWNAGTRLGFFAIVSYLLSRLRGAFERERALARTDHLTGVANSLAFTEALAAELERARRYGHPVSLIYLDLDNFKAVNDRQGHGAGDRLLARVGRLLRESLRASDVVGRLGGDEFALLLPETGSEHAMAVAHKVRAAIGGEMKAGGWPVTASLGVVTCPTPEVGAEGVMLEADRLMYRVKLGGKDGVEQAILEGEAGPPLGRAPGPRRW